jgi:hypothetical protein
MLGNGSFHVVPAEVGTQDERSAGGPWAPAFAGATDKVQFKSTLAMGQGR